MKKFASKEIDHSRLGIGFEKLDRMAFDPENAYDKVAAVGVKWVRILSGYFQYENINIFPDSAMPDIHLKPGSEQI